LERIANPRFNGELAFPLKLLEEIGAI